MRLFGAAVIALVAAASVATFARAADERSGANPLAGIESFPTPMAAPVTRIALILAGISAVSAGLALWSRHRRRAVAGSDANIRILANRSLTSRHQVVLLDVGGHRLLVGTGADAVTMLVDLTEKELFSHTLDLQIPETKAQSATDFLSSIGKFEGLDG